MFEYEWVGTLLLCTDQRQRGSASVKRGTPTGKKSYRCVKKTLKIQRYGTASVDRVNHSFSSHLPLHKIEYVSLMKNNRLRFFPGFSKFSYVKPSAGNFIGLFVIIANVGGLPV